MLQEISKTSPDWVEERLKVGRKVVSEGGTISEFGRRVGIQPHSASGWLQRNDFDLYRDLKDGTSTNILPREVRLQRLLTYREGIEAGLSHTKASERCGVSQNRMRVWLAQWAPDGIDLAIEDESFDELVEPFVSDQAERKCA